MQELTYRRACLDDLGDIVKLLNQDEFGQTRENVTADKYEAYHKAFLSINDNEDHYLMVVEQESEIIATCHLTLLPSLTFCGSMRLQIEAVRVIEKLRGKGIGEGVVKEALNYGKNKGVKIVQLMTDKRRGQKALGFYEKIGFISSHEGMKYRLIK